MRQVVFRVLAGLLAISFIAMLLFGDISEMRWWQVLRTGLLGVGFGLYAVFGSDVGEKLIALTCDGTVPTAELQRGSGTERRGDEAGPSLKMCSGLR